MRQKTFVFSVRAPRHASGVLIVWILAPSPNKQWRNGCKIEIIEHARIFFAETLCVSVFRLRGPAVGALRIPLLRPRARPRLRRLGEGRPFRRPPRIGPHLVSRPTSSPNLSRGPLSGAFFDEGLGLPAISLSESLRNRRAMNCQLPRGSKSDVTRSGRHPGPHSGRHPASAFFFHG